MLKLVTITRAGIFAGVRERRINAGLEYAQRMDESDHGGNTLATPRVTTDSTGRLVDGFIVGRPVEWFKRDAKSGLQVIARYDHFTPNTDPIDPGASANPPAYAGTTPAYDFWILGVSYDLNERMTFALDWQKQTGSDFPAPTATSIKPSEPSSLFLHFQATF